MDLLPFAKPGHFYRGNMHAHSTNSDGRLPPAEVVDVYRSAGYDFLVLTDHFMARYDWRISDTRPLRTGDFTTLIGAELHAPATSVGELWHIKAIGLPIDFAPNGVDETGPQIAKRAADAGAFIGIVHPAWYGLTDADAHTIEVAHAVEIYNHGSHIELDRGNDWPLLDRLLNGGWRLSGYASDDAHLWIDDCFGGWVHVRAEALEPELLLASLKNGDYYSSQGPEIFNVEIDGDELRVECSPVTGLAVTGRGATSEQCRGDRLTSASLSIARFRDSWFRLTAIDDRERRAWTNPVWLQ